MTMIVDRPDPWVTKAEQTRALAETMSNKTAKELMLEIATRYEQVAVETQRRMRLLQGG